MSPASGPPDPERKFTLDEIKSAFFASLERAQIRRGAEEVSPETAWSEISGELAALP